MGDWKERANKRRDERHTKTDDSTSKPKSAKKDTKKWCKGKEGREHQLKVVPHLLPFRKPQDSGWKDLVCTVCGKVIDRYWPMFMKTTEGLPVAPERNIKPAWIIEYECQQDSTKDSK